jgi:cell filamentation protein
VSDDPYVYPGTTVLRNKLGIRLAADLDRVERRLVVQRTKGGIAAGDLDLSHLQAIHRHLFQDIYEWAGEVRTVEISKGGQQFQFRRYIQTGMAYVHRQIAAANFLNDLSTTEFSTRAGEIMGNVNYVHPFREGNGRTQLQYLKQLAERAGHAVDLRQLDRDAWLHASREANEGRYSAMGRSIEAALL